MKLDATTITPPIAAKDDPAVAVAPPADTASADPPPAELIPGALGKATPLQLLLFGLGTVAFLYFARPVILPIFLACVAGMALKPLIRWLSYCRIRPALSAAVVLCLLMSGIAIGFFQLGRPALTWINEAPQHMTELRQRFQKFFPRATRFSQAAAAVNNLGATEEEMKAGSSTLSVDDLVDLASLANKLKKPDRPVETWLVAQLREPTLTALANYRGSNSDPSALQTVLVADLNRIIDGPLIYDVQPFAGVTLPSKTQQLLAQNPQGDALVRLNRLLLEDAYPLLISKSQKAEQKPTPAVEVKDSRGTSSVLNWTGTFLAGVGETLVLLYLLLASGDLFLQKLVHVMPTLSDKKRAVEISHEIQQNISNYLFSVTLINLGLGTVVSVGLYFMGVPNAAMWGMLAAVLNFVPYFGPVAGVILLAAVGILTFDTLGQGLLPPAWYLALHLLEANFVTPQLLGRRFTLNPVVIFVSLIFWTWLWGVPGALLSVPILVSIKVICDRVPSMSSVSELLTK